MRRLPQHPRSSAGRSVARPNRDANFRKQLAGVGEALGELAEWRLEVSLDVVVERLQWRDVQDLDRIAERRLQAIDDELIELPEECRQRLAGAGRREDQCV